MKLPGQAAAPERGVPELLFFSDQGRGERESSSAARASAV